MSVGELSGGDVKKAANERTAKIASEAGSTALTKARELLTRHTDLLDPALITQIGNREYHRAYAEAETARAEGRMNDDYSQAPGLTVFFTREGFEGLTEATRKDDETSHLAGYLADIQPADPDSTVYSLRLAQGMYAMGWGGCTFYGEATPNGNQLNREKPFSAPYDAVVRVEGDSGELWQNVNFQPDGTPIVRE